MKLKLFISVLAGLALSVTASAQPKGGGATAGPPANTNAESTSTIGKYANFDQALAHQRGGMYFSGKITVDGGSLPWDPIPIIVDCNGTVKYNTPSTSRGVDLISAGWLV